jgi:hypothetical protein
VKSSPKTGTCLEKKSLDLGDVVHRGVWIRPWHGPLPRPKPAPVMVLGNFLPKQFVDQLSCADQQLMKETPEADKRRVTNVSSTDVGVGLTQQVLRERAKCFGRPKIDLHQSRLKRLGKNLMLIKPRLAAAKQLQKPSSTAIDHLFGSMLLRTRGPTYAEMAARPPPQGGDQRAPPPPPQHGGNHLHRGLSRGHRTNRRDEALCQTRIEKRCRLVGLTGDHWLGVVALGRSCSTLLSRERNGGKQTMNDRMETITYKALQAEHLIELNTGQMLDPRRWCCSNNKHNTINRRIQPRHRKLKNRDLYSVSAVNAVVIRWMNVR